MLIPHSSSHFSESVQLKKKTSIYCSIQILVKQGDL